MSIKDIIILACSFTENEELKEALSSNTASLDEKQADLVNMFVECFNLIANEIASDYIPHYERETYVTDDFKINYSSFSSVPLKIVSVVDKNGHKVRFKAFDDYLMALASEVTVTYLSQPEEKGLNDSVASVIPMRIYAYGMAREYYLMQTLYEEADIWQERFIQALQSLSRRKNETRVPARRWL